VSYALPALVAIGHARHHHRPTRNWLLAFIRSALRSKTLKIARRMQPERGGYLEATPLTSFVVISLIGSGNATDPIVEDGIWFLSASARSDGSWPIDTNLATWVTTLSVQALARGGHLLEEDKRHILEWLLRQQVRAEHPFTHARPGGWAWTNLAGGVPDADDTAGALVAIRTLGGVDHLDAALGGIEWLLSLQNRDGGIPTFCRGWGMLPFDRSAPDLTAHALEAWDVWYPAIQPEKQREIGAASRRAVSYLASCQQSDGSWIPLWFGNEQMPGHVNPTYGTSRVVTALTVPLVRDRPEAVHSRRRGVSWLLRVQNADGGWGGGGMPSSIEETGVALRALALNGVSQAIGADAQDDRVSVAIVRGAQWLIATTGEGRHTPATPIGLYFAHLWYFEELYPLVFALSGLLEVRAALAEETFSRPLRPAAFR
jgi:squalene-hopene/tetraprenyl-beta-curcumene cyclase